MKIISGKKLAKFKLHLVLHDHTTKCLKEQCSKCPDYEIFKNYIDGKGVRCTMEGIYVESDKSFDYIKDLHKENPEYEYAFVCTRWLTK